jgi:hypothetical protein
MGQKRKRQFNLHEVYINLIRKKKIEEDEQKKKRKEKRKENSKKRRKKNCLLFQIYIIQYLHKHVTREKETKQYYTHIYKQMQQQLVLFET